MTVTETKTYNALDTVEAIVLAIEAADTAEAGWQLVQAIIAEAGIEMRPGSTACVHLLLEGMRTVGGSITVSPV